ncbi:MAG TPA: hypothetical protein VHM24_01130, partial [Gemmatimonadaceae bacterium]|nr:hypothetical protein [Gemmatimonadaceae bacterium]
MSIERIWFSRLVARLGLLSLAAACHSDRTTEPHIGTDPLDTTPTTFFVSAPSSVNPAGQLQLAIGSSAEETYTYVSASPGSSPGSSASITNRTRDRRSGSTTRADVIIHDGGFDPVRIAASAGDTLQVEFRSAEGSALVARAAVVPRSRPPTIVRTNPGPGKKDVPLNARFQIVF